ncbi:hypothetical protein [uncultured Tateyamaria sp.]|uniref:hypothetical protein n=1 Tax=Tateyamaria sp. 1078 TaxID=3417464 RepID=UPI002624CA9F|nr:hypothetical protein [uncultured Tateyamaria sp.]
MRKIVLTVLAVGVLGAAGIAAIWALPQEEPPALRLRAMLVEGGVDVTNKVEWFLERDDAWLGPDVDTVSVAVPGIYTAEFDILGGAPFTAEATLGEGQGGEVLAQLDAALVEIKLDEDARDGPVSLRFESDVSMGSTGLRVSQDGYVRALVSRDLRKLELELPNQNIPVTGDFASGAVMPFELTDGAVTPIN